MEPRVLLLDEPLSALDLKLRQHMRTELKAIQRKTGITFIYITHDQGEALTMSDRVAVMCDGCIQQVADPMTLYRQPRTDFVAGFVGENNRFPGRVTAVDGGMVTLDAGLPAPLRGSAASPLVPGDEATLYVRPEQWRVGSASDSSLPFSGVIQAEHFEGAWLTLEIALEQGATIRAHLPQALESAGVESPFKVGSACRLDYSPRGALVLPGVERGHSNEESVDVAATA
ncbi:ABC transporter ATP-binding protein [Salinicola acroporae]|uniref:ABC transporter ATP-binding protein n=1 Tax=Salinicola acroporae TaxID=1541440 RepID=UPI002455BD51